MCTRTHSLGCCNGILHALQVPALKPHHKLIGTQALLTAKLLLIPLQNPLEVIFLNINHPSEPYPSDNLCHVDLDQPTSQAQAAAGGSPSSNWHPEAQLHSATNLGVKPVLLWQRSLELRERPQARHSHRCCSLTPAKKCKKRWFQCCHPRELWIMVFCFTFIV